MRDVHRARGLDRFFAQFCFVLRFEFPDVKGIRLQGMRRLVAVLMVCAGVAAQEAASKPGKTTVNADGAITFRLLAPQAAKVSVSTDADLRPLEMTKDETGVWSVTTGKLAPSFYGYTFVVDGVTQLDPRNSAVRPSLTFGSSVIEVPGPEPEPWDLQPIPHGRVDMHVYTSHVAKNLPQGQETYYVYTPPGYDAKKKGGYPVLYLLHGWSDDASGWTAVGQANRMMDTMIAQGKAVPMIVVMPLGYGDYTFVTGGFQMWQDPSKVTANTSLFEQMLETEMMPAVEAEYNVAKGRDKHAITGLSMGGLESLSVGLHHSEQFAWVGGFSSAVFSERFGDWFSEANFADAKKNKLKLLWVACGVSDRLIEPNRAAVALFQEKGLPVTPVETPGAHTWVVWRGNLLAFVPMLFR